ncbi:MAG: NlpC/P60 family protein [Rickettsiales bacterium]
MSVQNMLIDAARGYLGVRFAHQGRSKQTGVDCLGLLICAAQDAGITLQDYEPNHYDRTDYGTFPDAQMLRAQLHAALIAVEEVAVGDILLLRIDGRPQHLALVTDYPQEGVFGMIHAYAPLRKVVEHRLDIHWIEAIEQVFRIPSGLADRQTT